MTRMLKTFLANEAIVRRIIAKYRPNKDDVDDLAQEAFLKCYAASLKEEIRDAKALLFRVAKNVAISESRRKRYSVTSSIEDSGGTDVFTDMRQVPVDDALHSRKKLAVFVRALSTLPEVQRRALLMRKFEGLKFKQIATRLGVSVSTVEKRVASALLQCDAYMREQGYGLADFNSERASNAAAPPRSLGRRADR